MYKIAQIDTNCQETLLIATSIKIDEWAFSDVPKIAIETTTTDIDSKCIKRFLTNQPVEGAYRPPCFVREKRVKNADERESLAQSIAYYPYLVDKFESTHFRDSKDLFEYIVDAQAKYSHKVLTRIQSQTEEIV